MYRHVVIAITVFSIAESGMAVSAQQVATQMPLQHNGSSFFEQTHISWGINNPHYFVSFNGGGATPPFGGFSPGVGLNGGFATGHGRLSFGIAQGSSASSSTFAPMLTTTSGHPGSLFIGSVRPFVVGVSPIVGTGFGNAGAVGPLAQRIANGELMLDNGKIRSSIPDEPWVPPAPQPPNVVRELAVPRMAVPDATSQAANSPPIGQHQADATAYDYLERAEMAERDGRTGLARIYYQLAVAKGDDSIRRIASMRLNAMKMEKE